MAFNTFANNTTSANLSALDANFTAIGTSDAASTLFPTATTSITYGAATTQHNFTGAVYAAKGVSSPTYTYATLPAASSVAAGTQFWTSDQGVFVSNGSIWQAISTANVIISSSNTATQNTTILQTALNSANYVYVNGSGDCLINDTLIIPSRTKITFSPLINLKGDDTVPHFTMLRIGNVGLTGSRTSSWNFQPICHSAVTSQSTGTVKLVKSGSNWTLSYKGQLDATYGSTQTITTSSKLTLIATGGAKLYGRFSVGTLTDGTYTQDIKAIPTVTPPKSATVTRAIGKTTTVYGNFSNTSTSVTSLSSPLLPGYAIAATGYITAGTVVAFSDRKGGYAGTAVLTNAATAGGSNIAITVTRYNVVTVTETAHGRKAGDVVMMFDDANFAGLFRIDKVVDTNTYTYKDVGSYIGSGSVTVYGSADVEIEFQKGARITSSSLTESVYTEGYLSYALMVNRFKVTGGIWRNLSGKYCMCLQGVNDVTFENPVFDTTVSDGFTCQGSGYDLRYIKPFGRSVGDNMFGIGTAAEDKTAIQSYLDLGSNGISGITIEDLSFREMVLEPIRLFGAACCTVDNVSVKNVRGTMQVASRATSPVIQLLQDSATPGILAGGYSNFGTVILENIYLTHTPDAYTVPIQATGSDATRKMYVDKLSVRNSKLFYDPLGSTWTAGFMSLVRTTKCIISNLVIKDNECYVMSGGASNNALFVDNTELRSVSIIGGIYRGTDEVMRLSGSSPQAARIVVDGGYLDNNGQVVTFEAASAGYSLSVQNLSGNVYNNKILNAAGITPTATCALDFKNNALGNNTADITTGTTWRANGDIWVDGNRLTPQKGDTFYNTSTTYNSSSGVGVYMMGTSAVVKLTS